MAAASVDTTQTEKLLRLLDTVVIKLEGGTDDDLKVLDEKPVEPRGMDAVYQAKSTATATATSAAATFATVVAKPATDAKTETVADKPKPTTVDEENWDDEDDDAKKAAEPKTTDTDDAAPSSPGKKNPFAVRNDGAESAPTDATNADDAPQSPDGDDGTTKEPDAPVAKKRKRSNGSESSSSSSSSSSSDDEDDEHKAKAADAEEKAGDAVPTAGDDVEADDVAPVAAEKNGTAEQKSADPNDADANTQKDGGSDAAAVASVTDTPAAAEAPPAADTIETIDLDKEEAGVAAKPDAPLKALHRTSSIFLRNLAPTITKAEVEATCRRYAGFLRVAIADPLVKRRWFRRGWVTFERDVNIKEICWNLNNIRLRDCELGAIVNRDLSRRVRPINGITGHRQIVRNDIKLCAKIAINLDARAGLWTLEGADTGAAANGGGGDEAMVSFGLHSSNPVLQNITDYLIEEASAEEDELLGYSSTSGGGGGETTAAAAAAGSDAGAAEALDRDPQLIAVLDRLILYLRVVHSVDFYNHCEYPYEDEMPNRCGIIHARGPAPQQRVTQQELQEYQRSFEGKMSSFLARAQPLAEAKLRALGSKDAEGEVEKFVVANTQELAKDKWLCPLSGKKFKGPDFIRKHIFNKHAEKVDEVRKEVEYFNNFLKDPKRPQLPEHPGNQRRPAPPTGGGGGGGGGESASGGRGEGGPPHHGSVWMGFCFVNRN